jgi:hypothetical protein
VRFAAYSIGASSAWARSVQWLSFAVPFPTLVQAVIARAMISASSHAAAAATGDQRSSSTPSGSSPSLPAGSNSQTVPSSARACLVACITSCLVLVLTAGPGALRIAGIITALVFPLRGGPRIITALSPSAVTHSLPSSIVPRYAPPPR